MNIDEISNITSTLNQFNKAFEFSGLTEMQDTFQRLNDSINCSLKPIIELSDKWNKTQQELFGSLQPALNTIAEFSNKVSETLVDIPKLEDCINPDLINAFEKYETAAPPCLYTTPEVIISTDIDYSDDNLATKEDVQELRLEIKRLRLIITNTNREKFMDTDEFSDEAEYIYSLILNQHKNEAISKHSATIKLVEFLSDLSEEAFKLGLEELQNKRFIANYESYIDGSFYIELCLRCTNALKTGITKLSTPLPDVPKKQHSAKTLYVMTIYPQFEKDYDLLLSNKFIEETDDGLIWLKKKQCLAEYFGDQKYPNDWKAIELLFNTEGLKALYNNKQYDSKDYQNLIKLLKR